MENISKPKRKRKLDPSVIRIGDRIKVINPLFVERVGYPLSFKDGCEKAEELYTDKIKSFLDDLFPKESSKIEGMILSVDTDWKKMVVYDKIVNALGYYYLQLEGFGGKERKLFLKERPMFKDDYFYVSNIGIAQTGTYYSPSGCYDSYGESDWEPGGLSNRKTHKILQLTRGNCLVWPYSCNGKKNLELEALCIEACNVEKIFEENK